MSWFVILVFGNRLIWNFVSVKSKTLSGRGSDGLSGSQNIRRTASLDTIYLKGQWPRDSYYIHTSLLVDKATQVKNFCNFSNCINWLQKLSWYIFSNYCLDWRMVQWTQKDSHSSSHWTNNNRCWNWKVGEIFQTSVINHLNLNEKYKNLLKNELYKPKKWNKFHRLQRQNKESTSSRERTAAFGLIMPGGPPPALPGDHSVTLPSIASQTLTCKSYRSTKLTIIIDPKSFMHENWFWRILYK